MARKNLAPLGGMSLVRRALLTASACDALDSVLLSSEDEAILSEAQDVPRAVALRRPAELATDRSTAAEVAAHALAEVESSGEGPFDAVAVIQCTSPFTLPDDIAGTLELLQVSGATSAVTVTPVGHHLHPWKLKRKEGDRLMPLFEDDRGLPHHSLPEAWIRNGSVYAALRTAVESGQLITSHAVGYVMPRERSVDINDELDLAFAQFLLESGRSTDKTP
jgi:CMP-N,N'-diacetyllegionaminic acid synthase